MKKIPFILTLLVIILLLIGTFIFFTTNNKEVQSKRYDDETLIKLKKLDMINEKIDYFNFNLIDRYISYKEKNIDMNINNVIINVNIGLDYNFYENVKEVIDYNSINILVNKYNYLNSQYVPSNLEEINKKYSNVSKVMVNVARVAFEKMVSDAKELGYTIRAILTYRSYEYQNGLYTNYSKKDGIKKADTYSTRPGYSEYQNGLYTNYSKKDGIKKQILILLGLVIQNIKLV